MDSNINKLKKNKKTKKVLTNAGAFTIMKTTKEQRTKDFKELQTISSQVIKSKQRRYGPPKT